MVSSSLIFHCNILKQKGRSNWETLPTVWIVWSFNGPEICRHFPSLKSLFAIDSFGAPSVTPKTPPSHKLLRAIIQASGWGRIGQEETQFQKPFVFQVCFVGVLSREQEWFYLFFSILVTVTWWVFNWKVAEFVHLSIIYKSSFTPDTCRK